MREFRSGKFGLAMIYTLIAMTALTAFVSLAVDFGRVELAKTQLQAAADDVAMYAASGITGQTVSTMAIAAASDNSVDGVPLVLQSGDIETGTWDNSTKAFTASGSSINAVRITAHRAQSRNTGIPTVFMKVLGQNYIDLKAVSVATFTAGTTTTLNAPAQGDPWLAGMPSGTTANTYDAAPANSPSNVSGVTITPGAQLQFSFTGNASYYPGTNPFDPDGDQDWIIYNYTGVEHGMSQLYAPLASVVGVFLDANAPNTEGAAPPTLDFTSTSSRDFATLSPQLRQPFFIGDGLRADGTTKQSFVVPTGATRLYIGIMDGQQWSDNSGAYTSTIVKPGQSTLVK